MALLLLAISNLFTTFPQITTLSLIPSAPIKMGKSVKSLGYTLSSQSVLKFIEISSKGGNSRVNFHNSKLIIIIIIK